MFLKTAHAPGSASGDDYRRWVRVCFTAVAPPVLAEALAALRPILQAGRPGRR